MTLPGPEAAAYDWSGAYFGAQGGYGWVAGEVPKNIFDGTKTESADGAAAAIFGGYSHQLSNNFVVGIDAEFGYNWNDNSYAIVSPFPILNGQSVTFGTEWRASVEGRVGYAFDRILVFASGGWTATRLDGSFSLTNQSFDEVMNGWTLGAGIDYALTDNVFARLKASYSDYGSTDIITKATGIPGLPDAKLSQASLMAGIGFKF
nr:outer membrane beta-barrel protein [Marinicella sp. W31]MDC2876308.1 outer membrane beta-barrel protein [Marinicella sp. W31]